MTATDLVIRAFDYKSEEDLEALLPTYAALQHLLHAEELPDDPPLTPERVRAILNSIPDMMDIRIWLALTTEGEAVAYGRLRLDDVAGSRHLAGVMIAVAPQWRRRGLATRLLAILTREARASDRSTLFSRTTDRVPAGEAFMKRIGAQVGIQNRVSQLDVRRLDRDLLTQWQQIGAGRCSLQFMQTPFSDEELVALADLAQMVQNDQPRGDLSHDEVQISPQHLAGQANLYTAGGRQMWAMLARDSHDGQPVGGTVILLDPAHEPIVQQLFSGVYAPYRRQGLAKWLKAEMLQKLLRDWPAARFVRTDNAMGNEGILKINHALGFRLYYTETLWETDLAAAEAYIGQQHAQ